MADLSTNYLGLKLRNPFIVGSSGLTESLEGIQELEKNGAGAVVLKSLFEEEIIAEMKKQEEEMKNPAVLYPEMWDYFDYDDIEDSVTNYLGLISGCKKHVGIPVIASINCVSSDEWPVFAKRIQNAGADALELNAFVLPSDFNRTGPDNEKVYFDIIEKVKKEVDLPVSLKISYYFSNLGSMVQKLSETGIEGLVLFNRFWSPDFDIDKMTVVPSFVLSNPGDLAISLRWTAILANRVSCDIAASTGVYDGASLIKQILAGANAVQVVSALYKNGADYIGTMLKELEIWMDDNDFASIEDFRGKMSQDKSSNPAAYERGQFMKHFRAK